MTYKARLLALLLPLTAAFSASSATAAVNCEPIEMPKAAFSLVQPANPDQGLINKAILAQVNYERCKAGLGKVKFNSRLASVAQRHATWMANNGVLSHRSNVSGMQTPQARIMAAGLNVRRGAENIGALPHFPSEVGGYVRNARACKKIVRRARHMPDQTYAQLAQTIVDMWMKSRAHRENLLNPHMDAVGHAISYTSVQQPCGQFYLAQNFAG